VVGGAELKAMVAEVFGDDIARPLVLAHAAAAFVLAGSMGHVGVLAAARLRGREVASGRLLRHLGAVAASFGVALVLGLLAYPHYRYHVRGLVLDRDFPSVSNLFDLKEHAAALAVPLWFGAFAIESTGQAPRVAAALMVGLCTFVLFVITAGLWVTMVKGP
jgi:hypothetical protein